MEVLNAKPEAARREAEIIAQAGMPVTSRISRWGTAAVTIATSMAGRGTDIRLGGDAQGITKIALRDLYLPSSHMSKLELFFEASLKSCASEPMSKQYVVLKAHQRQ